MKKMVIVMMLLVGIMSCLTGCGNDVNMNEERIAKLACEYDNLEFVSFDGINDDGRLIYTAYNKDSGNVSRYIVPMDTAMRKANGMYNTSWNKYTH